MYARPFTLPETNSKFAPAKTVPIPKGKYIVFQQNQLSDAFAVSFRECRCYNPTRWAPTSYKWSYGGPIDGLIDG